MQSGVDVKVTKSFFRANGKAVIEREESGFLRLLWNKKQGTLIGASIVGPSASELIHIAGIAIQQRIGIGELKGIVFGHPTLSEVFGEAIF